MTYTFVIPNFNNADMLGRCLFNIRKLYPKHEIIVCDDASKEIDAVEKVCSIYNAKLKKSFHNNGFSYNCNRGIEASTSDAVILVNNDVIIHKDILSHCDKIFSNDKIGVIGFLLYYPNGNIQHGGLKFDNPHSMRHEDDTNLCLQSRYVISVTGALMAIRKSMTDEIGAFNAGYYLAFEDTEFCLRTWHSGYKVWYCADVSAIHYEGYTRGRTPEEKRLSNTYEKEQETYKKYCKDIENYSWYDILNKVRCA